MYVAHLLLHDFRSYAEIDLSLEPGISAFVGPNGQGKTNLVEAVEYVATLGSHRVATDTPLVRAGAERAVVRADVVRDDRHALGELEIVPGKGNRARLNKSPLPKTREILGLVRAVLFAPDDLSLAKGDPSGRRRYLDDLLVARAPRFAGVRHDYDRVLKQRSSLLKTAGAARHAGEGSGALGTLDVWDAHLARAGAELLTARQALVADLRPFVADAYAQVAHRPEAADARAELAYEASCDLPAEGVTREAAEEALLTEIAARREDELARGVCLVGPHRDDLTLTLNGLPVRGYASHGESWSFALALRLACFELLRADGDDPVLILDDVFAELDQERRTQLAALVAEAEQVLVTTAVPDDLPAALQGARFDVMDGKVSRVG